MAGANPKGAAASSGLSGGQYALFIILILIELLIVDLVVLGVGNLAKARAPHYYMALGNSLSYGYQPDLNLTSGFVDDVFADLRQADVTNVVNYACAGETSQTMIDGGCPGKLLPHTAYNGPQLTAAVAFLQAHPGVVSPITLEIGANDVIADFDDSTCTQTANADADLARLDDNLTRTILPRLLAALKSPTGTNMSGDLHLLNYYNLFAKICPNSAAYVKKLNDHLAADAGQFRLPVVDVYNAFGGDLHTADNICTYTWFCDPQFHDIHPTTKGYQVIAQAVERALALPGPNPLQNVVPPQSDARDLRHG